MEEPTNNYLEQREKRLVKTMLSEGYDAKDILGVSDIPELDLRREKIRGSIQNNNAGKEALKNIFGMLGRGVWNILSYSIQSYFTPTSFMKKLIKKHKLGSKERQDGSNDDGDILAVGSQVYGLPFLVSVSAQAMRGGESLLVGMWTVYLGSVGADMLYNLYQSQKGRVIERRRSELEKITTGMNKTR